MASLEAVTDYDVVIAGGGMVGASLALQLCRYSQQQLKLLVVENFAPPAPRSGQDGQVLHYSPSFDARSTALSYSSRLILDSLGLWPQLSQHVAAINSIHVSDRGNFGSTTLDYQDVGWQALGYVVENAWLGKVLLAELQAQANITFMAPAQVECITPRRNSVALTVQQGGASSTVVTQLAIIADGANSGLRKKLGIEAQVSDYRQSALIANVSFKEPHNGRAYERFTDQGPLALLPLTDDGSRQPRAALVWSLPHQQAAQLSDCDQATFLAALQQRFGHRQGELVRVGERFSFALQLIEAREQVRSGIVIMGNAAHSLHPVAGQGFNLALRDCTRLSRLLVAGLQRGQRLGELALLQQYCDQQYFDQRKTIGFSDQIPALFRREQWAVSLLRGMGLGMLDIVPGAKSQFIYHAAGLHDGAALG